MTWNPSHLPSQHGRVFVVTGGNAGLGYFTAEQLATTGARVVIAGRNRQKADAAIASILARTPSADLGYLPLDLASLASAGDAGRELAALPRLDGLVLNAGMTSGASTRQTTEDGLELTIGTNFVGHFVLTAAAMPALLRTPDSRVVGLGSLATRIVRLDAGDLLSERKFEFFRAYGFSKHAIHGFTLELDRRLRRADATTRAILAHPGYAVDGLSPARPGIVTPHAASRALAAFAQGKNRGAAPTVRALLDPAAQGGELFGPRYLTRGEPRLEHPAASSASPEFGRELWRLAEEWTGTPFVIRPPGAR